MMPGARLDLKKRIAASLSQQEWRDVDLTLGEFGFSTGAKGSESREDYILRMLAAAPTHRDDSLVQLDAYLHPTKPPEGDPETDSDAFDDPANPWTGGFRLSISHIHDNARHAGALREELAKRSIDAFVAHDSIKPTEEWVNVIECALRTCDGCAALLAPGFKESDWTDQEVGACVARGVLVIPIEYGLMPYGFLERYQALPVADRQQAELALAIFELLVRKEQSRDAMAWTLVKRWANTRSFDAARENYAFLKTIPRDAWSEPLRAQALQACEENES
jgi:hypothetical protein